jgi:hypothetical protein
MSSAVPLALRLKVCAGTGITGYEQSSRDAMNGAAIVPLFLTSMIALEGLFAITSPSHIILSTSHTCADTICTRSQLSCHQQLLAHTESDSKNDQCQSCIIRGLRTFPGGFAMTANVSTALSATAPCESVIVMAQVTCAAGVLEFVTNCTAYGQLIH